jgi:hypothetical protein
MPDDTRDAVTLYRRTPVLDVLRQVERDDRVDVLRLVVDNDRRARVREAATQRIRILSTRGPPPVEAPVEVEPDAAMAGRARSVSEMATRLGLRDREAAAEPAPPAPATGKSSGRRKG